jgi:Cys-tRNA(Pro)/Cys-tRNA(Cys) deacylase
MTTRGIERLKCLGIPFERLDYDPRKKGVRYAAAALDLPPQRVLKSLVFESDKGRFVFALMSGDGNVSARKLARAVGCKRMRAAAPRDAQRVTGYRIGGMSPLGARTQLPIVLDGHAAVEPWVVINAGDRGVLVRVGTEELTAALDPLIADIRV